MTAPKLSYGANGNSAAAPLLDESVRKSEEIQLSEMFRDSGWVVREHFNDHRFRLPALDQKEVAFSLRNEEGRLDTYSGVLDAFSKKGNFFKLAGEDEIFNANMVGFMAVSA